MNYGFDETGKYWVEFKSSSRPVGNMREEHERRAREIADSSDNIWISLSGGVDSQAMLHSFHLLGKPVQCLFMHLPGYNDNEYEQVKILEQKYKFKANIVSFDIMSMEEEIVSLSDSSNVLNRAHVLQSRMLKYIPDDCDYLQMNHDPFVWVNPQTGKSFYFHGYHRPETARARMFEMMGRSGRNIFWGDTPEFLCSILNDSVFKGAIHTARYFDQSGLSHPTKFLTTVDRWDMFIKPIIYGKYWQDELIYFPKFAGSENVSFLKGYSKPMFEREHAVIVPYFEFCDFLKRGDGSTWRISANVPYEPDKYIKKSDG